ncbi:MAG: hypothetical protein BroJett040_03740 [Oligoflexia bacterium]|nr:MAG: hypothetical protein BroJett040_03740 [Oligoflexia bacterium]
MRLINGIILFGTGLILSACSNTLSSNIKTSGFYVTYSVNATGGAIASCEASFNVGGSTGTYVDLDGGDTVTCNGLSMSRYQDPIFHTITYKVNVPAVVGGVYEIKFVRVGENPYSATVTLPAPILATAPAANANIVKGSTLTASWVASTDPYTSMAVNLSYSVPKDSGSTTYSYSKYDSAPENGTVGWGISETQVYPAQAGPWTGTVKFTRSKSGEMAAGLSGYISAEQTVSVSVSLVD